MMQTVLTATVIALILYGLSKAWLIIPASAVLVALGVAGVALWWSFKRKR